MNELTKADVKGPVIGLFLMIIFTSLWAAIAEISLNNRDHKILGAVFVLIIITLIANYIRSLLFLKKLPEQPAKEFDPEAAKRKKQFLTITTLEGVGIGMSNILLSIFHLQKYFIPCMALIVGLHFLPLSKVFNSRFHFYMGCYTTFIALLGLMFIRFEVLPPALIAAFVCVGCSLCTIAFGIMFITQINAKRLLA